MSESKEVELLKKVLEMFDNDKYTCKDAGSSWLINAKYLLGQIDDFLNEPSPEGPTDDQQKMLRKLFKTMVNQFRVSRNSEKNIRDPATQRGRTDATIISWEEELNRIFDTAKENSTLSEDGNDDRICPFCPTVKKISDTEYECPVHGKYTRV